MTSGPNTLLIDGTDLRGMTGIRVVGDMNLYSPGIRRGSHDVIPGRSGQLGNQLPYDSYAFAVTVWVAGATREAKEANLRALGVVLAGTNGLVTLTRRLARATSPFYDEHTAAGQFVQGLDLNILNSQTGMTELQFVNLDGRWWTGSAWLVP